MEKRNIFLLQMITVVGLLIVSGYWGAVYSQEIKKIMSIEAYDMLNTVPDTYLIDVRTREEYQYVGHPVNAYLFPYMLFSDRLEKVGEKYEYRTARNKDFVAEITKAFKKTDNLLILSRDGSTSALGAKELTAAGFKNVFDITDGFEGADFPTFDDENRNKYYRQLAKRNKIEGYQQRRHYGWQWWGLPWTYDIDTKYIYPPDVKTIKK